MTENTPVYGTPIGFIVEGDGEFQSYPSLIARIIGNGYSFRINNAGGNGNILKNLDEQITDLVKTHKPYSVIITIDLQENLGSHFQNCKELFDYLTCEINNWITIHEDDSRVLIKPQSFIIIIQIKKFETWMIADRISLHNANFIRLLDEELVNWTNVDDQCNPLHWLNSKQVTKLDTKKPRIAKKLITAQNVEIMSNCSKSFNKFFREITKCYNEWEKYKDLVE